MPLPDGSLITGHQGLMTRRTPDGDVVWRRDLRAAVGQPIVHHNQLVVPTAAGTVAVDLDDGTLRWWHPFDP